MNETSVTRDAWADIAAELHRIANDVADLIGQPPPSYVGLDIQPYNGTEARDGEGGDAATIAATDGVAVALLGRPAESKRMSGGAFHHTVSGVRGSIRIGVFQSISDPAAHERDIELERLRAEVAELRGKTPDASGFGYSRADDNVPAEDMTLTQPGRIEPHNGGMTEGGLVDETTSVAECGCPVHPYAEGRGDGADTIVRHAAGICTEDLD